MCVEQVEKPSRVVAFHLLPTSAATAPFLPTPTQNALFASAPVYISPSGIAHPSLQLLPVTALKKTFLTQAFGEKKQDQLSG